MPTYNVVDRNGNESEIRIKLSEFQSLPRSKDDEIKYDGKWYSVLLNSTGGSAPCWGGWGFRSDAMGVNPDQIPEQVASDRRHGVTGVKYDRKTGEAVYESRDQRKKHMKAFGFHSNNSYGRF